MITSFYFEMMSHSKKKVLLVSLILLVCMIAVSYLVVHNKTPTLVDNDQELRMLAELLASDHQAAVSGIRQLLIAISSIQKFQPNKSAFCEDVLKRESIIFPYFLNIGATDATGKVVCSGVVIEGEISFSDNPDFKDMLKSRDFTVSGYRVSQITGWPSVRFLQPIFDDDGTFIGATFVTFATQWLNAFPSTFDIPHYITITKFDVFGNVFMRYPNPTQWSGTNQADSILFRRIVGVIPKVA